MPKNPKPSPGDTKAALPPATCSACLGGSLVPVRGERVAWKRLKSCGIQIGYVEWSFDGESWFSETITFMRGMKLMIKLDNSEMRRVCKLLIKNRQRGGVFEREKNMAERQAEGRGS